MTTFDFPPIPCDACGSRRVHVTGTWKQAVSSVTVTTDESSLTVHPPRRWTVFLRCDECRHRFERTLELPAKGDR